MLKRHAMRSVTALQLERSVHTRGGGGLIEPPTKLSLNVELASGYSDPYRRVPAVREALCRGAKNYHYTQAKPKPPAAIALHSTLTTL
eukprot:352223-Chlamydomonas_euryale.AAC.8